ncbi:MAG: hypothetical protein M1540_00105 [Candidatus Bathyarchaeota archaeon]|nr:hypothetical protein [Candidatus Bathyarchaeota archaeon]
MEQKNQNHYFKCPHCACLFFSQADLKKHTDTFGTNKEQHDYQYKKTHGRMEHGYSDE